MNRSRATLGRVTGCPRRQRGVALITVLFVFFMASTMAVAMLSRQQLDIRKTINLIDDAQARQYALGAEAHVRALLSQDWQEDTEAEPRVDHLQETWAQAEQDFEIEGGVLQIQVEDLQGRFNLANLLVDGAPDPTAVEQFKRLLVLLQLNPAWTEALLDWMDDNNEPLGGNGAEDNDYLVATPAYRAANRLPTDISELLLLPEVAAQELQRLRPYVTVLPEATPINLNSASVPVLRALLPDKAEAEVERWLQQRQQTPFTDVQQFLGDNALSDDLRERLSVDSSYFRVAVRANYGERSVELESLIHRDQEKGTLSTLARDYSRRFIPVTTDTN